MEEKEFETVDNKADGDAGKLDKIETLLREQQAHNRKMLRSSHTHTVILIIFVVVFAIGLFALNATFSTATQELPAMMRSATEITDTATREIGKLEELDIEALNDAIKGISSIRFDVLSQSIEELQKIISPFASFMGNFG